MTYPEADALLTDVWKRGMLKSGMLLQDIEAELVAWENKSW
jgi:hypothetical protein